MGLSRPKLCLILAISEGFIFGFIKALIGSPGANFISKKEIIEMKISMGIASTIRFLMYLLKYILPFLIIFII